MKAKRARHILTEVILICGMVSCGEVFGQGTVFFSNPVPIYDVDGKTPLAGPGFLAELYAAPVGGSLSPIDSSITPFLTAAPGYFANPNDVTVPGTVYGGSAMVQVAVWRASDGATFAEADHGGAHVGQSGIFTVTGLGSPSRPPPAPSLDGMQSFSLYVVPEPPVFYLCFPGLGCLMLWCRWR